jgi:hypothetical protein
MFKTASKEKHTRRSSVRQENRNNIRTLQTDPSKMSQGKVINIDEGTFASYVQPNEKVLSTHFNQDCSCLAISTNLGFKIFSLLHP